MTGIPRTTAAAASTTQSVDDHKSRRFGSSDETNTQAKLLETIGDINRRNKEKEDKERGIIMFNQKPKKGVESSRL